MLRRVLLIAVTLLTLLLAESMAPAAETPLVSITAGNIEVTDVVKALASQSGADFIVAEGVEGRLPFISLHDMPLETVLDTIVRVLPGIAWRRSPGVKPIYELVQAGEIEFYGLRYGSLEDTAGMLGFYVPRAAESLLNPFAPYTSTQSGQNATGQAQGGYTPFNPYLPSVQAGPNMSGRTQGGIIPVI